MQTAAPLRFVARKNLGFCYSPLSRDEDETVDAIISTDKDCDIVVSPSHHLDCDGIFHGFRVAYPPRTANVMLPISREMFFGHTIVEASTSTNFNPDVMALAAEPERARRLMRELLDEINENARGNEPNLHCIPQNVQSWDSSRPAGVGSNIYNSEGRSNDSQAWQPELPVRIGIYHSFVRGFSKDVREHKIFIGVTGGCTLAAEHYYNLLLDVGLRTDVDEINDSEETFWLRQASFRARCRLLHLAAEKFGLEIKTIADINAYNETRMALATTDTVYNNIARLRSGHVAIFNECTDTTLCKNGVVHAMHPSEGLWVYKGVSRSSGGTSHMGFGFGDQGTCGIFPTATFCVQKSESEAKNRRDVTSVFSRNPDCVVAFGDCDKHGTVKEFSWPDESYFGVLREMGWDRNNGIVELIPIIVGITRW